MSIPDTSDVFMIWLLAYEGTTTSVQEFTLYMRTAARPAMGSALGVIDYLEGVTHPDGVCAPFWAQELSVAWSEWIDTLPAGDLKTQAQAELTTLLALF